MLYIRKTNLAIAEVACGMGFGDGYGVNVHTERATAMRIHHLGRLEKLKHSN